MPPLYSREIVAKTRIIYVMRWIKTAIKMFLCLGASIAGRFIIVSSWVGSRFRVNYVILCLFCGVNSKNQCRSVGKKMSFDRNDPADLLALKNEVTTDPLGLGYDTNANVTQITEIINSKDFTVSKPKISSALVRSTCTYDAYNGLAIDEQEWLTWMTGSNGYEEENMTVTDDLRTQLAGSGSDSIWAVADRTAMVSAMTALIDVPGSRAEVLFGYGTSISTSDWTTARDS